jgi:hypothetical protein
MIKKLFDLAVAGVLGIGALAACNSPTSSKPGTIFLAAQMALSGTAVQGWDTTAVAYAGTYNDTTSLFNAIDGQAGIYWIVAPFSQAFIQGLGNNQDTVSNWVFSYAGQSTAASVFKNRVLLSVNDSAKLAPYSTSVAIGDTVSSVGVKAYAHFGNCYFELIVNSPTRTRAIADAVQFLQVYEKKINAN